MAFCLQGKDRIRVLNAEITVQTSTPQTPGTLSAVSAGGLTVACGEGTQLLLTQIQLPGKKPMRVADIINGQPQRFEVGIQFSGPEH